MLDRKRGGIHASTRHTTAHQDQNEYICTRCLATRQTSARVDGRVNVTGAALVVPKGGRQEGQCGTFIETDGIPEVMPRWKQRPCVRLWVDWFPMPRSRVVRPGQGRTQDRRDGNDTHTHYLVYLRSYPSCTGTPTPPFVYVQRCIAALGCQPVSPASMRVYACMLRLAVLEQARPGQHRRRRTQVDSSRQKAQSLLPTCTLCQLKWAIVIIYSSSADQGCEHHSFFLVHSGS
jgi:hypothetical protein